MNTGSSSSAPGALFEPRRLRAHVLRMAFHGQSVHVACAFSIIEMLAVLYASFLRLSRSDPTSADRDYLILSKGHGVMALYACFHELGWISEIEMDQYFRDGTRLRGLCESHLPGCEVTSGSLGHGLPIAAGIALGLKRIGSDRRVYCIVGDGELNEGVMWETILFAAHHDLDNLTMIVDANQFQAMGRVEDVLALEPLLDKFESFRWRAMECDGHDMTVLSRTLATLTTTATTPTVLVARTVKGYGVSFTVADNSWHYKRLSEEMYRQALTELGDA